MAIDIKKFLLLIFEDLFNNIFNFLMNSISFFGSKIKPLSVVIKADAPANFEHNTFEPKINASLTTAP